MQLYTAKHLSLITGVSQRDLALGLFSRAMRVYVIGELYRYEVSDAIIQGLQHYAKGKKHGNYLARKAQKGNYAI